MKILTLSIKQKFFDQILSGEKKQEYREVTPKVWNKYARFLCEGKEYKQEDLPEGDSPIDIVPVKYDALKLVTGQYKGNRPYLIVEVKSADVYFLTDEENKDVILVDSNGDEYIATEIEYQLGQILETSVK